MRYPDGKTVVLILCAVMILYTTFANMSTLSESSQPSSEGFPGTAMNQYNVKYFRGGNKNDIKYATMTRTHKHDKIPYELTWRNRVYGNRSAYPHQFRRVTRAHAKQIKLNVFGKGGKKIPYADLLEEPPSYEKRRLDEEMAKLRAQGDHVKSSVDSTNAAITEQGNKLSMTENAVNDLIGPNQ